MCDKRIIKTFTLTCVKMRRSLIPVISAGKMAFFTIFRILLIYNAFTHHGKNPDIFCLAVRPSRGCNGAVVALQRARRWTTTGPLS